MANQITKNPMVIDSVGLITDKPTRIKGFRWNPSVVSQVVTVLTAYKNNVVWEASNTVTGLATPMQTDFGDKGLPAPEGLNVTAIGGLLYIYLV